MRRPSAPVRNPRTLPGQRSAPLRSRSWRVPAASLGRSYIAADSSASIRVMASADETATLLERSPMFAGLNAPELEELAKVAVPRSYEPGQVVFREGDEGDTCFVIRTGAVKITREHGGRTIALAELRAGDTFGELSMFGGEVRSATAQALEQTHAVALLAGDIRRLLAGNPEIALKMLETMANRVRATNQRLANQSFQTVAGRVAGV